MLRNYKNFSYIILVSFCFAPPKVDSFWEKLTNFFSCNVNHAGNNEGNVNLTEKTEEKKKIFLKYQ